jgi:ribosome-associated toxin RatA of RatAB toxin-antitoxin module
MSQVVVSHIVSSPVANVWAVLADFGGIHHFSAGVQSSPINDGTPSTGVGAERNCHLYDGNNIQERITEFVENRRIGIDIFQTSMPLKTASASFELEPAEGGCKVTMTMDYEVKYGILGKAMDAMMMKGMMTKNLGGLLRTLDEHLVTGEDIPKGWKPSRAA